MTAKNSPLPKFQIEPLPESELGSNPSHIGVRFTRWFTSLKAFSTCLSLLVILRSLHEASVMAKVD
jgi:hypothetical protein